MGGFLPHNPLELRARLGAAGMSKRLQLGRRHVLGCEHHLRRLLHDVTPTLPTCNKSGEQVATVESRLGRRVSEGVFYRKVKWLTTLKGGSGGGRGAPPAPPPFPPPAPPRSTSCSTSQISTLQDKHTERAHDRNTEHKRTDPQTPAPHTPPDKEVRPRTAAHYRANRTGQPTTPRDTLDVPKRHHHRGRPRCACAVELPL